MIPKVIHYCWFGGNKLTPLLEKCISTWKHHLKDYEFILWNEENFNFENQFVNKAYNEKKWAFVSDYARLKILNDYGGIYLDTDMFLIKPFDNEMLNNDCFFGVENEDIISCGIIGAIPNHFFIKNCLKIYDEIPETELNPFGIPITKRITASFRKKFKYELKFTQNISINDVYIYKYDYFYPYPYNINKPLSKNFIDSATQNTYAIHLWTGSWQVLNEFHLFRRGEYLKGLITMTKNSIKEKSFEKNIPFYKKIHKEQLRFQ
jgi:Glycosyltransferase sugar-binding region containing DXD motif